jgi:hypothetical protein
MKPRPHAGLLFFGFAAALPRRFRNFDAANSAEARPSAGA